MSPTVVASESISIVPEPRAFPAPPSNLTVIIAQFRPCTSGAALLLLLLLLRLPAFARSRLFAVAASASRGRGL